jgi:hypothetical protein
MYKKRNEKKLRGRKKKQKTKTGKKKSVDRRKKKKKSPEGNCLAIWPFFWPVVGLLVGNLLVIY